MQRRRLSGVPGAGKLACHWLRLATRTSFDSSAHSKHSNQVKMHMYQRIMTTSA